jgi:hypothetical protein
MPRLFVNAGTPNAWAIDLRPGVNTLGRNSTNHFQIEHGSVSGSHCQITVETGAISVRDLGSTNGTFIDRTPIQEQILQPGQTLQLGSIELLFEHNGRPVVATTDAGGLHFCRYHPKTPARLVCPRCAKYFCDLCVGTRQVNHEPRFFCKTCSVACLPIEVDLTLTLPPPRSFMELVPDAFAYPLRGIGPFFIILMGLLTPAILFVGFFNRFVRIASIAFFGFMYACLQNFVICSAQDERKPSWPEVTNMEQDIWSPLMKFFSMALLVGGPAIVSGALVFAGYDWASALFFPALVLAGLYFPMALLAVAMFDTLAALNPLFIIPSIAKVAKEYLLVLLILGAAVLVKFGGDWLLHWLTTIPLLPGAISSLLGMYFLMVTMRLLGSLYLSSKDRLGWFK